MRYARIVLLAGLLLAPLVWAAEPVPQSLDHRFMPEGPPLWLSHSAVVTEEGEVRWDLLEQHAQNILKPGDRPAEGADCIQVGPRELLPVPGTPPHSTLRDLARHSAAIYHGRVTAREPGFFQGYPGLLLQVEVLEKLATGPEFRVNEVAYVFYPRGTVPLGDLTVCAVDLSIPPPPEVGERLLTFSYGVPLDEGRQVIFPVFEPVFLETAAGELRAPHSWRGQVEGLKGSGMSGLLGKTREWLREVRHEGP